MTSLSSLLLFKSMLFANAIKKKKKLKIRKAIPFKNSNLNMCRVCNKIKGYIPIFNNFVHPNIPEEIQNFSGVTLSVSDSLPKNMCQSCLDLLNGCIKFREMCQRSNENMIELSIKKENRVTEDTDEFYNIPSPAFSEENPELLSCSDCTKDFCDLESYNNHLPNCNSKISQNPKPSEEIIKRKFLCDVCGKTAYSNANLLVHMGTHENVFPFKCDECPYQGRTMDLLKVHKRSHLVDKPYKCTQCPKATTTSSNLAKHMRHVHSTTRPFKCNYCEKAFSYQHDMKRHIRDIHLRQGTVECDVCYKKFNTKKILQGHRWKIHKIKGERQGRLPAYLQCQGVGHNENYINDSDHNY